MMHDDSIISHSVHPQHEGSQEHFELPNRALFSCLRVMLLLYHVVSLSRQAWYPTRKGISASQPSNHLGRVVSCQFPGRYIYIYHFDSSIVQPPFILHSIGHNRVGSCWCIRAKDRCEMWGHLGSILLVKRNFWGPSQIHQQKQYRVSPHLDLQKPEMLGHLRRFPTPTTHCCHATCIDFDTHSFCLLTQPATKLSQGNDVVALSTSKRTPKEIETSKNEKHVETLDQLGLEPQGTRWVHPAKRTTQGFHEKHPQEMILGCQNVATCINHNQLGTVCVLRE